MADASSDVDSPEFWEELYRSDRARWDLGGPTPVVVGLVETGAIVPGRILIPGCGRGHDAVYLARHGFAVTGIDFSQNALASAHALAASQNVAINLQARDVFQLPTSFMEAFDLVFEYVTYCAVDPRRRGEYVDVLASVLRAGGYCVGLFFPVDGRKGGPPFAVPVEEVTRLFTRHFVLVRSEIPERSIGPRKGKEILMVWQKK